MRQDLTLVLVLLAGACEWASADHFSFLSTDAAYKIPGTAVTGRPAPLQTFDIYVSDPDAGELAVCPHHHHSPPLLERGFMNCTSFSSLSSTIFLDPITDSHFLSLSNSACDV